MSEANLLLLIAMFETEESAEQAITNLKRTQKELIDALQGAVAIRKDEKAQVQYKDVGLTPAKGTLGGAALGAVIGVLSGGVGLVLGALGGLVGGLLARIKQDERFSPMHLHEVIAAMPLGSSALLAIADPGTIQSLEEALQASGASPLTAEITADIAAELEAHQDQAHAILEQVHSNHD